MPETPPEQQALAAALARLFESVARLAVARGLPYAAAEEMLKIAFVEAAASAHPGAAPHRSVSRISTVTGINRREVTRLVKLVQAARGDDGTPLLPAPRRSVASEVFHHWRTQPPYARPAGRDDDPVMEPLPLPRQGPEPSFETLAGRITRDVHPRSLLDELVRLNLAVWDTESDVVTLVRDAFVPSTDRVRMLEYLGDNVGDHLVAAVDNILGGGRRHHEQALYATGLSAESIARLRPEITALWRALTEELVPRLQAMVEADGRLEPTPEGRVRIGLFSYDTGVPGDAGRAPPAPAPAAPAEPAAPRDDTEAADDERRPTSGDHP